MFRWFDSFPAMGRCRPMAMIIAIASLILLTASPSGLAAQSGSLAVLVVDVADRPLAATTVQVEGTTLGVFTGSDGRATLAGIPVGEREIRVQRPGFGTQRVAIRIEEGRTTELRVVLQEAPMQVEGIQVQVLRPDLRPDVRLDERQIQEANPQDVGDLFRALPGLDAIRRGGLGMDPVVRGLRDTQVGAYVDGMRTLPGGPGGMDTPLSHVDPSAVRSVEVVKGPYALTWGAGNLSAVRIETQRVPPPGSRSFGGRTFLGYNSNLGATETGLEFSGSGRTTGYILSGAWRESGDYESGGGVEVPGSFRSGEVRGRFAYRPTPSSTFTVAGWHQAQRDIDYPGRPMDAEWFDTFNGSLRWEYAPAGGALRSVDAMAYVYTVDHGMNNDAKPAPMRVATVSDVEMVGGRLSAVVEPGGGWTLEAGGDGYTALHFAEARPRNPDMPRRLIWGDVRLSSVGLFTRAERMVGPFQAAGTLRLDLFRSEAETASPFFIANVTDNLSASEEHVSGAATLTLPLDEAWSLSVGAGSVVRPGDANERYSDRHASKRSQVGAEFMGDPSLRAERSNQVDFWVEASYPRWTGALNLFAQRIQDHVSIEATDLTPRAAPRVFRYVNGEASYRGAEATGSVLLTPSVLLSGAASYLRGRETSLGEAALGVSPLRGDVALRWDPPGDRRFVELATRMVARQDRVATTRGEMETPGYTRVDLQAGHPFPGGFMVRVGVENLFDREYHNHLNAVDPFSRTPVPEPGRVAFARVSVSF